MSSLETAEKAVEQLSSEDWEAFLQWFSSQLEIRLGQNSRSRVSMQELADRFDSRVKEGAAKPFKGVDTSEWPPEAHERAGYLIREWEDRHGK